MGSSCGWTVEGAPATATWTPEGSTASAFQLQPFAILLEDGSGFLEFEDCALFMHEAA